jgi:hypothetical protein
MRMLDELIREYGVPDFCKIDVEGYEFGVIQGLSRPIPALALEFEQERADERLRAVDHVANLGMREFNFSFGESRVQLLVRRVASRRVPDLGGSEGHSPVPAGAGTHEHLLRRYLRTQLSAQPSSWAMRAWQSSVEHAIAGSPLRAGARRKPRAR